MLPMLDLIIKTYHGLDWINFRGYMVSDDLLEWFITLLLDWHLSLGCIPLKTCITFLRIISWRWLTPLALFLMLWQGCVTVLVITWPYTMTLGLLWPSFFQQGLYLGPESVKLFVHHCEHFSLSLSGLDPWCRIQSSKLSFEQLLMQPPLLVYPPHPLLGVSCCDLWYRASFPCCCSAISHLSVMIGGRPMLLFPGWFVLAMGTLVCFYFGDFLLNMLEGIDPPSSSSLLSLRDMSGICVIVTSLLLLIGIQPITTDSINLSVWPETDWPSSVAQACPAQTLLVFMLRNENILAAWAVTM